MQVVAPRFELGTSRTQSILGVWAVYGLIDANLAIPGFLVKKLSKNILSLFHGVNKCGDHIIIGAPPVKPHNVTRGARGE